jgi:hypothetical protein
MNISVARLTDPSPRRGPETVDDTPEKRRKTPMTTTLEDRRVVDNASRIVDSHAVDDNTPSHLASSTPVDAPSRDEIGVVDTAPLEAQPPGFPKADRAPDPSRGPGRER